MAVGWTAEAIASVPLPQARPAEAPKVEATESDPAAPAAPADGKPAAPATPEPSACRKALTEAVAIAPSIPDIKGPGACGGTDLVRLEAVVLADRSRVAVTPAAVLRCSMAGALADWIRTDVATLAEGLGTRVAELDNFDSFECRGRNRVAGAKLSEHGKANAIDVRAIKLANGRSLNPTDRAAPRDLREKVLASVCGRFTTVLGPGSDWYHEDHIHLDLAERRGGYRICQWGVWEAMPVVAPLLPAARPDEAPPRAIADASADTEGSGEHPPQKEDAAEERASPPKPAARTKKRRADRRFP